MATGQGTKVTQHSEPRGRKHAQSAARSSVPADVRTLDLQQRLALRQQMDAGQRTWLGRLGQLVEPPAPAADFPAFLLETAPFAWLRAAIGSARKPAELSAATREDLQCFVDAFANYLRTTQGEDVFTGSRSRR